MPHEVDILSAYLPLDRAHALARGESLPSHTQGAALLADISGFTPLTEALARDLGPRHGAEELTRHLNQVYDALINEIHRHGGHVISFAGDAMTCWFDAKHDPLAGGLGGRMKDDDKSSSFRATACALAMQNTLRTFAQVALPSGSTVALTMKVAVATGPARRFVVGDPQIQLLDVVAGATLTRMAAAEHLAQPGEVIGDASTVAAIEGSAEVLDWRTDESRAAPATGARGHRHSDDSARDELISERFAVMGGIPAPIQAAPVELTIREALTEDQLRPWLLPVVYERLRSGQGEFLAELRLAVALFIRFEGIDYDNDESAGEKLDAFIRRVQGVLNKYEGVMLHFTTGDKGSYLNAAFGAPLAHEDDARRAVSAALELQALPPELYFIRPLQIGITRGGMRAGAYGGRTRRIYDVMGDDVNLAARLMQAAAPGEVLVSEALRRAASRGEVTSPLLTWESLPPQRVKGKAEPISVYRLVGRAGPRSAASRSAIGKIVGRVAEREQLAARLDALARGQSGVCIVEGEAGIGKSRLVSELLEGAARVAVRRLSGAGDAIEKSTPYHAWRSVFTQLFEWDTLPADTLRDARRAHMLTQLPPGMEERAPLLNVVLPLDWPDNELTAQMSGEVRADNTRELLLTLLQQAATQAPLLLVLDDVHWLDSASWALALAVSQRTHPLLLVIVTRPLSEPWPDEYTRLRVQPGILWLSLEALPSADILALVCQRLGVATLPDPVAGLIREKAEGHPFFSEELAYALRDSGVIVIDDGECRIAPGVDFKTVTVPDTVEGVITSRIDRLAPSQQLTLKVASVIGRVFAFRLLRDVHPLEADKPHLADYLSALERLDLTPLDTPDPDLTYIFKHIITQEVAYNLMTFAQRRELHHAVGKWYEYTYASDLSSHYPILAYHWSKTDERTKAILYLEKAGEQALAQYANQEAVSFLSEASRLADGVEPPVSALRRARWERQMGEACLKLGRHAETRKHSQQALALLGRSLPTGSGKQVISLLGQVVREVGRRLIPAGGRPRAGRGRGDSSEAAAGRLEAARAYFSLGELAYYEINVVQGLALMLGIVDLLEGDKPSPELVNAYAGLSVVASHIERAGLAEMYGRLAQATAQRLGRLETEAFVLQVKAVVNLRLHRWEEAYTPATQAVALFARLGDRRRWEECMDYLGYIAALKGEFTKGVELILEIVASARERNDANSALMALTDLASLQLILGQAEEALGAIQTGFGLLEQSSDPKFEMRLCARLVQAHLQQGDIQRAEQALERGKRQAGTPSSTLVSAAASDALAQAAVELWEARGQPAAERQSLAQFLRQSNKNARGDWRPIAQPLLWRLRGWEAWVAGRPARARQLWRKSLAVAERLKIPHEAGLSHYVLGQHPATGKDRQAHWQKATEIFERLGAVYDLVHARRAFDER